MPSKPSCSGAARGGKSMARKPSLADVAGQYVAAGLSVIPTNAESKAPTIRGWGPFQNELPNQEAVGKMFSTSRADSIAVIGGPVSGNLEFIDFDFNAEMFPTWSEKVNAKSPGLFGRLIIQKTQSGGRHVIYRVDGDEVSGNTKLAARRIVVDGKGDHEHGGKRIRARRDGADWAIFPVYIETRGVGGYALVAPSPGYEIIQGDFLKVTTITASERQVLIDAALALDERPKTEPAPPPPAQRSHQLHQGLTPLDDFNQRGDPWPILERHGWQKTGRHGEGKQGDQTELLSRPGKDPAEGHSAGLIGGKKLTVWSSNADPFEPDQTYSPVDIFMKYECNGDPKEAARRLRAEGYGDQAARPQRPPAEPKTEDTKSAEKPKKAKGSLGGVEKGKRRKAVFSYAFEMIGKGLSKPEVQVLAEKLAANCEPPLPKEDAAKKVKEAYARVGENTLEQAIEELNSRHFAVTIGGKFQIANERIDPIFKRNDLTFSSPQDFKNKYLNRTVPVATKNGHVNQPIAGEWLKSPQRREYDCIVFQPSGEQIEGAYNLYQGLAVQPKKGEWGRFDDFIWEIICGKDDDLYKWVFCWLARLVQDPGGDRPGTALALRGQRGTGKNTFVDTLGRIFGQHYLPLNSPHQITGRFNSHLKDALLVHVNEGFWAGDKRAEGVLKSMITDDTIPIEAKGKDIFTVRNFVSLIFSSNESWVVPAGLEERRFCVLDVAPDRRQDKDYFKKIRQEMASGGLEAMLHDLLDTTIEADLRTIPNTEGLLEQKFESSDVLTKFWIELLRGEILDISDRFIETEKIFLSYSNYANELGRGNNLKSYNQISKELKKFCPSAESIQRWDGPKRHRGIQFPNLEVARTEFEATTGYIGFDWGEPGDGPACLGTHSGAETENS